MTFWKQGASAVRVLARLRIIFGSAGIGIGGVLPIGTALVTESHPRASKHHMRPNHPGNAWPRTIVGRYQTSRRQTSEPRLCRPDHPSGGMTAFCFLLVFLAPSRG